jgi:pimeloyl-ACP methyl ester carboxylesterase
MPGAGDRRVASGGVSLAVRETGDGDGPAVVFIHGYPDTKEMWSEVLACLPARFHAIAYDVRGAGASDRPRRTADYDFERLGDDLLAVIDACAPGGAVHLVGHDWGGLQGWEFATQPRFEGRLASYTAIAGPSLDQVAIGGEELLRSGHVLRWLGRLRRSWYILTLLTPGLPALIWRGLGRRWDWVLRTREGLPPGKDHPAPTVARDAVDGARLYRRNMPRRSLRPRRDAFAHVPVQLVIPTRDRFISPDYYELAERYAPRLRRRTVDSGHWAPRAEPALIAAWIEEFVDEVEKDSDARERNRDHAPQTSPSSD